MSSARATALIGHRVAEVDAALSPYRAMSALSRFNRAAPFERVEMPDAMAEVLAEAFAVHEGSDGAFDPTTGPLVHRFGFGPITGRAGRVADIAVSGNAVWKTTSGSTLDLCGIAKGHALDLMAADLVADGARQFLLELGGEVRAYGQHPSGRDWRVAIEDPLSPSLRVRHVVAPGSMALATSGHRAQGLIGSIPLSHVIDPRSARPATGFAASVSVLAATGMQADAWATALLALGAEGPDFARARGLSALFILGPDVGGGSIITGAFGDHLIA
jgi:thiamine biosynthesis lipoprotein